MSLFLSYTGRLLEVTAETDAMLADCFPELDRQSEYREADSWLYAAAPRHRPKNARRFLRNWFVKSKRAQSKRANQKTAIDIEAFNAGPSYRVSGRRG